MGLELPEIINIYKQMDETIKNKVITEIRLGERCKGIIKQGMCNLDKRKDEILNSPLKSLKTRGKWIFLEFENKKRLLLGEIIGKFSYYDIKDEIPDNYHILFKFKDKTALTFQSSLYAFIVVADQKELDNHKYAGNIGPTPLDKEFTYKYFTDLLNKYKNRGIKGVLNIQGEISGLGNAYINDILFKAKIHPKAKVSSLNDVQRKELYNIILETLNEAVNKKGSVKEYDIFSETGNYIRLADQPIKDLKCERCETKIVKMNVMGSNSYLCPNCQKI